METSAWLTSSYASQGTKVETVFLNLGHHGGSMGGHLNEARIMSAAPTLLREVVKAEADGWNAVLLSSEYDVGEPPILPCGRDIKSTARFRTPGRAL
jgi:hypothetical protein